MYNINKNLATIKVAKHLLILYAAVWSKQNLLFPLQLPVCSFGTTREGIASNTRHAAGNCYFGESDITVERPYINTGHTVCDTIVCNLFGNHQTMYLIVVVF